MNSFLNAINVTHTDNGALTYASTNNYILDFFYHGATLRNDIAKAKDLFYKAFYLNPTTALRILFYIRDVRGGQGEREVFRECMFWLAKEHPVWVFQNWKLIPEYGRWDDLVQLADASLPICSQVCKILWEQLVEDIGNMHADKPVSLLAKWMPSENASNLITRARARFITRSINLSPKTYRKTLVALRRHISIVENKLRTKNYKAIKYEEVPSKALLKYRKAFYRNDERRFIEHMESVNNGTAKIHSGTLYPYEIFEAYNMSSGTWRINYLNERPELEAMWKSLPDYVDDINGLVVADTSGSMGGRPLAVSLSLAAYISERNKNEAFKNHFITFDAKPTLQKFEGNTLLERMKGIKEINAANTNLQAVFDLVLDRAMVCNVPKEDMPKVLIIVSDMQFDIACRINYRTNLEEIRKRYEASGYEMPKLVFWNVASHDNVPAKFNNNGVLLLSGCNPSVLKYAISGAYNPMEMVYQITESDRYKNITFNKS